MQLHSNYKRKHRDVSHDLFEVIRQRFHSVLLHRITLRSELQKIKGIEKKTTSSHKWRLRLVINLNPWAALLYFQVIN